MVKEWSKGSSKRRKRGKLSRGNTRSCGSLPSSHRFTDRKKRKEGAFFKEKRKARRDSQVLLRMPMKRELNYKGRWT